MELVFIADPSDRMFCGRSFAEIVGSNPAGAWMALSCACCVCFQVEVSAMGRSLIQRSPTECGVFESYQVQQ